MMKLRLTSSNMIVFFGVYWLYLPQMTPNGLICEIPKKSEQIKKL